MIIALLILVMLVSLAAAAFCAAAETGFLSVSRERIEHLAREGGPRAIIVRKALSDMGRTTTALLIGNNIASVCYSSASAALALLICHDSMARSIWSFAAAALILYVAEFMPKLLSAARPLRWTLLMARAYRVADTFLRPLTALALFCTGLFVPRTESRYKLTSSDIIRILRDRKDGVCLSDIESALVGRIIALRIKGKVVTTQSLLDALTTTEE